MARVPYVKREELNAEGEEIYGCATQGSFPEVRQGGRRRRS